MITVVELLQYIRRSDKLLTEDERRNIVNYLAIHPTAGDIMRGTGGIRKLRWKRGGHRQKWRCPHHLLLS